MNLTDINPRPSCPVEAHVKQRGRRRLRQDQQAILAVVSACVIWGSSFVFGKVALESLPVSQVVLIRFAIGSAALVPVLMIRRLGIPWRDLPRILLIGFLAVPVTYLVQFSGLELTSISRASLIIGASPPLMALGGLIFFGERPGWRTWIAVGISILGIVLISGSPGVDGNTLGDVLVLVSIVVSVGWVLLSKNMSQRYGALEVTGYVLVAGTLMLLPFTYFMDGLPPLQFSLSVWRALIVLGIGCTTLTFFLWNWGLERLPASKAGVYLNLEPLVGVLLGVTLWGESLQLSVMLGGALVLVAGVDMALSEPSPAGGS